MKSSCPRDPEIIGDEELKKIKEELNVNSLQVGVENGQVVLDSHACSYKQRQDKRSSLPEFEDASSGSLGACFKRLSIDLKGQREPGCKLKRAAEEERFT